MPQRPEPLLPQGLRLRDRRVVVVEGAVALRLRTGAGARRARRARRAVSGPARCHRVPDHRVADDAVHLMVPSGNLSVPAVREGHPVRDPDRRGPLHHQPAQSRPVPEPESRAQRDAVHDRPHDRDPDDRHHRRRRVLHH